MPRDPIEARLEVMTEDRKVEARLTLTNVSESDVFLWSALGPEGDRLTNNLFEIRTNDERVKYIGRLVKRSRPGPDEYVKLEPKDSVTWVVRLDKFYDFPGGRRDYTARFSMYNPYPDRDGFSTITSNLVEFSLK